MEAFLLNLLKNSLLFALAAAVMLAAKPLWREKYRAETRCWLWLALAVFLLLPLDLSAPDAPVQLAPPKDYTLLVTGEKTTVQATDTLFAGLSGETGRDAAALRDELAAARGDVPSGETLADAAQAQRYIPVWSFLFALWAAGAAVFALRQGAAYGRFRASVRRWQRDVTREDYAALLDETAREIGVKAPEMRLCEAVTTPAVTGVFRAVLLLPHENYAADELRFILRHELCHLKRRDMLLKLTLLAANTMHWFNPLAYLVLRQADEDIELACDSAATQGMERAERADYSRTLLAAVTVKSRAVPATTCFGGTVERLKRRITNVLGAQKKRGLGLIALVLAMTLAAGCATGWGGEKPDGGAADDADRGAKYESMDAWFDEFLAERKAGSMSYYVEENVDYPDGVTDAVADARLTGKTLHATLADFAEDGAVLELWSYGYEQKPANEKGLTIMLVGGQALSDDGYLNEGFTSYLTVLHRESGEDAGYEIIGMDRSNDGLWYDGVGYGEEYTAYLHDFYVDYAGLDTPKYYIPDLLGETVADGYGREDFVEAQLVWGGGYYFYAPLYAWGHSGDQMNWYSSYDTGSSFNVRLCAQSVEDAAVVWSATGAEKTKTNGGYRFVTSEGLSNTTVYLFATADEAQHYEVSTHWEYNGSADNEWGWNHDRAVEQEAKILAAMAASFRVNGETLVTQDTVDSVSDDTAAHTPDETEEAPQSASAPADTAVTRDSLIKSAGSYVDLGGYLWYTAGGKLCRWYEGSSIEMIDTLPLDYDTPVKASLSTQDDRLLMSYHLGGATMGTFVTDLYDMDGKKLSSIYGYNAIAISGDIIVMTDYFMPTPNNLSISYDCGKTFTKFGDEDWFYGSTLTEDGGYVTSVSSSLTICDGYVYTTAVYDIEHQKTSDPLVTRSVRINLTTGVQEILG